VGAEAEILPRLSLVAGFSMRNLINQPYSRPAEQYYYYAPAGSTYDSSFGPLTMFSLGLKLHSRSSPLSREEKLEEQRDLARIEARRNRRRKPRRAVEQEDVSATDPQSSLKMAEGKRLMNEGQFQQALAEFTDLQDVNFPDFNFEMSMGYCHYMLKNWPASLRHYQKALELEPDNAKLRQTVESLRKKSQNPGQDEKADELLPK